MEGEKQGAPQIYGIAHAISLHQIKTIEIRGIPQHTESINAIGFVQFDRIYDFSFVIRDIRSRPIEEKIRNLLLSTDPILPQSKKPNFIDSLNKFIGHFVTGNTPSSATVSDIDVRWSIIFSEVDDKCQSSVYLDAGGHYGIFGNNVAYIDDDQLFRWLNDNLRADRMYYY